MSIVIDATYEDGVLKPAEPLPLAEHAQVRVTVEPPREPSALTEQAETASPWWEEILALTRNLPEEAFAGLPTDGAAQHDHYIYGTPKRTDMPNPE